MKNLATFLFEIGQLKQVKRSGWWMIGVKDPESVAEHSHRTAIISYILAHLEKADAMKTTTMCLLHDLPETRINDIHKVGNRYLNSLKGEQQANHEQIQLLPKTLAKEFKQLFQEFNNGKSKEAIIAKDADYLECAIQAKEYIDLGYKEAKDWIKNVEVRLKTKSAKKILTEIKSTQAHTWFHGLKKLDKRR